MQDQDELFERRDFFLKTIMELEYRLLDSDENEKQETIKLRQAVFSELDKVNKEISKALEPKK